MSYGLKGHLGFTFQESFGTPITIADSRDYFPIISESITEDIPPLIPEGMRGRFEEANNYEGAHSIAGDVVLEAHPIGVGKMIKAWCNVGSVNTTNQSSTYEHVFIPDTSDFDDMAAVIPMSVEVYRDAGSAFLYSDVLANTLSFEIAHGALMKATMGIIGANFQTLAKTTPSYPAGSLYPWNVSSVSLGGSAIDEISNLTLTFNNALEGKGTLDGTKTFNRIKRNGYRTCEIAGTLLFTSQTEADNFVNQTIQRLIITMTGETIGNSANLLKIDIPRMRYAAFPVNIAGMGQIEVGFTAKAEFDETSSYLVEFTAQNTRAAY